MQDVTFKQSKKLHAAQKLFAGVPPMKQLMDMGLMDMLEDRSKTNFDVSSIVHGPMYGKNNDMVAKKEALLTKDDHFHAGTEHLLWMQWQREAAEKDPSLAHDVMGINIAIPNVMPGLNPSSDEKAALPFLEYTVLINDVNDVERITTNNVKKQPGATTFLFNSVLSTTDNDYWKAQRRHLTPVFMPHKSLSQIFPISVGRAQECAERLKTLSLEAGPYGVQMNDFYLHEAMAQLQLALFGMRKEFAEETNEEIRKVFSGDQTDPAYMRDIVMTMMKKVSEDPAFATASDAEVVEGKRNVFGPLSKTIVDAFTELDMNIYDQFGNTAIILFAGHDTTAHTMTWLTYELARNPHHQARLQAEVDAMFSTIGNRDMIFDDCNKLPFMTKCIMETLRYWTVVPNGTFRELESDETIKGPGGKPVTLPKGTYVQIANWMRHRNPVLWGPDANTWNPDREFHDNEDWGGKAFHSSNPASARFSPFTFGPRDCMGKNFAQLEMRAILSHVLRAFTFELSTPWSATTRGQSIEMNIGTCGPVDLTPEGLAETELKHEKGQFPKLGMYLHAIPRQHAASSPSKL